MATAKKKAAPKKKVVAKKVPCCAKTKEGKKCKNMATGKSRFCSSHKK
jgi:hypothetical protein